MNLKFPIWAFGVIFSHPVIQLKHYLQRDEVFSEYHGGYRHVSTVNDIHKLHFQL